MAADPVVARLRRDEGGVKEHAFGEGALPERRQGQQGEPGDCEQGTVAGLWPWLSSS